ncbi:phospholipase effector Tle1 domain-containing protein [Pseudomonas sp. WOUb67]|uniref:phospholipase effector Tle1 domain-containing protein n=1 Tax=Pseudomonas sp. WOUb67 TaxID=3161136 RepID=UPI003CED3C68
MDGTDNNKDRDTPLGGHTNVARLYEYDTAHGTNLAFNSSAAPGTYGPGGLTGQSEKIYLDGVGSQKGNTPIALIERGTGRGSQNRIEQAYDAFVTFCNKNPDLNIELNVIGFSRGAAQARAFTNEVIDRGVPRLDSQWKATDDYLIPPGQAEINKLAIFDTVASYGIPTTESHVRKNLEISKNVRSTTHLVAMHEYRATFPLTSALRNDDNSRIEEVKFAGAHSQVGGGYRNDLLAAGPLAFMYDRLKSAGVELGAFPAKELERIEQYNALIKDPERLQDALIDSRLLKGNEAFKREADGSYTRINNRPFPAESGTWNFIGWETAIGFLAWQQKPFDHPVAGRKVIFENDRTLAAPLIQQIGRHVGQTLAGWNSKVSNPSSLPDNPSESMASTMALIGDDFDANAAESRKQVAELSSLLAGSKPEVEHIQRLALKEVPVPGASASAKYAVLRVDPEGSSAFADLGFGYEAARIVADAGDFTRNRGSLSVDDPIALHDTNGNVVGSLEAVHEAPTFAGERGFLVAIDIQDVAPGAQAGFIRDGLTQVAQWIVERPEGSLKDEYEIAGADGRPRVRAMVDCPVVPEQQRTVTWEAPEP